jgi:hypothetical protein
MNQSENIHELAAALAKAQGEMQAAIKDSVNPFFKSKYADLGSVWDAARPVLSKNGLCIIQSTEVATDGKVIMVTTLAHSSGQWIKSYLPLNPSKNDSQGIGAAITYLRRYSLSALVGVVCDDDDDGETAVGRGKATPAKVKEPSKFIEELKGIQVVTQEQRRAIDELFMELDGESRKGFLAWCQQQFDTRDFGRIPQISAEICMRALNAKIKYLKDQERVA